MRGHTFSWARRASPPLISFAVIRLRAALAGSHTRDMAPRPDATNQRINESTNQRINESTNQRINELRQLVADLRAERLASELLRHRIQSERRQRQTPTFLRGDEAA